jgi:hypothetical protein
MSITEEYTIEKTPINESPEAGFSLELGDIIEIISPSNTDYHNQTFFITYIDATKIKLMNISTYQNEQLNIDEDGNIRDESILEINLLSRSEVSGFARQNNLLPKTWIDIHFGGEIPSIVTGEITNLEEDQIEITSFPDNEVFFINFEYQGIPEDIPIDKIAIREAPRGALSNVVGLDELTQSKNTEEGVDEGEASVSFNEQGEMIIKIPENSTPDENIREVLQSIYLNANELFGQDLEDIFQDVEVPEYEKRYGIDIQVNDLTDELLSTIPNSKRTEIVLQRVQLLVERFKELRNLHSTFDSNGFITGKKIYGDMYKPLIERILNLDTKLKWIIPVVSQRKKIYSLENIENENPDIVTLNTQQELRAQYDLYSQYYKNQLQSEDSKYDFMNSREHEFMTPFLSPAGATPEDYLLFHKAVQTDLEFIVSNLEDFSSTVTENAVENKKYTPTTSTYKYFIQKYNLGFSRVKSIESKKGQRYYLKTQVTHNDHANIKSIVCMPKPIIEYSKVHLPGTNLLTRSHLSQLSVNYFQIFNKSRELSTQIIDAFDKEVDYENEEESAAFLSQIKDYILDPELLNEDEKFQKMLNVILPKTRTLIRMMRNYIQDGYTLHDIVKSLEPFMVYKDNITYGQYNEIRYSIKEKIKEYKKKFAEHSQEFRMFDNEAHRISNTTDYSSMKTVMKILTEKKEIENIYLDNYFTSLENKKNIPFSSELLHKVYTLDCGMLFMNLISVMLLSLVTPDKLFTTLEKARIDTMDNPDKIQKECIKRFLAKKYHSIAELQKDNNVEDIYYDKEYDDTPYDILKKYKEDQKRMLVDEFPLFLAENLVQKHECPRDRSKIMAETLITGKKKVRDGEYAIVEFKPVLQKQYDEDKLSNKEKADMEAESEIKTYYHYYRRVKDHWVKDNTINEESFMDTNSLFCNIDFKCHKNPSVNTCDSTKIAEIRMRNKATDNALREFDDRLSITVDEMKKVLEDNVNTCIKNIKRIKLLRNHQIHKMDIIANDIGKYANTEDIVVSPYSGLYDIIMSQDDFTKKQRDICKLVNTFCREHFAENHNESPHWLYCNETDTKLIPRSIYELAFTYVNGHDYGKKLAELCNRVGTLSEDGDAIVDKHCGCVLRKIDFVSEEVFDDAGFKLISHSIMDEDVGKVVQHNNTTTNKPLKEMRIFNDELSQMVYNIFSTLCTNMNIPADSIDNFVIRFSCDLINNKNTIMSEKSYNKKVEKIEKEKGKPQLPYPLYKNQAIIIIVAGVTLIGIQSAIPSIQVKKTFPGCIRSFSGYPMESGVEDNSGLKYIACVVNKTKSSISPWNSIQKLTATTLETRIKEIMERFMISTVEVQEMYMKKREYIILRPDDIPIEEHSISKWKHFLPPIIPYSVKRNLHNVSSDFHKELLTLMQNGNLSQREFIDIYKSKNIIFSYAIIESIHAIVDDKSLLLKTMAKVPFLENACCNETDVTNPIEYFQQEDENIRLYKRVCNKNEEILKSISMFTRPNFLFNTDKTALAHPEMPTEIMNSNIYGAFIHYCNFDNERPIPDDLHVICSEKPNGYDPKSSLEEKIEFLKRHGKTYTIHDLYHLMSIIARRNLTERIHSHDVLPIHMLKDVIDTLEQKNSKVIEEPIRKLLLDVLRHYNPKSFVKEEDNDVKKPFIKSITNLRNYLIITNTKMHTRVMEFFDKYGNLTRSQYNNIQDHVLHLTKWNLERSMKETKLYYDESLYTVTQFIHNSIYSMTRVYPNAILYNANKLGKIHKHWGLSQKHMNDLQTHILAHQEGLEKYKGNPILKLLLEHSKTWSKDILLFIEHIPVYTSIVKENTLSYHLFDKRTIYLLYSYCWYSILYEFIISADDADMIRLDKIETREHLRGRIRESNNDDGIGALSTMDNEMADEDVMIDIQILSGEKEELKRELCSLLLTFVTIEMNDKKSIDLLYSQIARNVKKSKEKEKKEITDFFENIDKKERQIEFSLKKFKMGRWNAGMQKGIFKYDKDVYDKERETATISGLFDEMNESAVDMDTDVLEWDVGDLNDFDINREDVIEEGNDLTGMGEDFMDGVYYEEDEDRDFGYD